MFNWKKIEKLKAENENLKSQLELNKMKFQQLQQQYDHKNNELVDLVSSVFLEFKKISEDIATRNDYANPEQKIRQIKEYAETQKNYYAQYSITLGIPNIKNRTTTTDQSNR